MRPMPAGVSRGFGFADFTSVEAAAAVKGSELHKSGTVAGLRGLQPYTQCLQDQGGLAGK